MTMATALSEAELLPVSVHECGHYLAAKFFGVPAIPEIACDESGRPSLSICRWQFPVSPIRQSVISWSGVMAEHLTGCIYPRQRRIPWPLNDSTLADWVEAVVFNIDDLSQSDKRGINSYPQMLLAASIAFGVLSRNLDELKCLAALLVQDFKNQGGERQPSIPSESMPPKFPATAAEFRALVIGGNPETALQRHREFIAEQLKEHLAGLDSKNPEPFITAHLQESFRDVRAWRFAARNYLSWASRDGNK